MSDEKIDRRKIKNDPRKVNAYRLRKEVPKQTYYVGKTYQQRPKDGNERRRILSIHQSSVLGSISVDDVVSDTHRHTELIWVNPDTNQGGTSTIKEWNKWMVTSRRDKTT